MGKSMVLVAILTGLGASVSAQWQNVPRATLPRLPDGRPNLTAPAPRRADGKPDLSGVWNPPAGFIRDLGRDLKEPVPFQPWAKAEYDVRASGAKWREEPDANCLPQGVPKILWAPAPWRIVQTRRDRVLHPRGVQPLVAGVHGRPAVQRQPRQRADVARLLDGDVGRRHARRRQPRVQRAGLARSARQAVHREAARDDEVSRGRMSGTWRLP